MAAPSIDCKIEPLVNGKLVYLPVAPERQGKPASGMVAFELKVKNNQPSPGQGKPKPTLKLKSLQVSFPGSGISPVSFTRNESIAPSATETLYLDEDRDKIERRQAQGDRVGRLAGRGRQRHEGHARQGPRHR